MNELTAAQKIERQQWIASQTPLLLAHILQGALSNGKVIDPKTCADLAVVSAEALYDRLIITN